MSGIYAVKKEDMPKIYRGFMDQMDLSAIPDSVITEQADRSAELGLNPSNEAVSGIVSQVEAAFQLPTRRHAEEAAFGLWAVYHSTAQAMERLGAKTFTDRVGLESEAMSMEVMRKIAFARPGEEAGS